MGMASRVVRFCESVDFDMIPHDRFGAVGVQCGYRQRQGGFSMQQVDQSSKTAFSSALELSISQCDVD